MRGAGSQLELTFDHGVAAPAEKHTIAVEAAVEQPSPIAGLQRGELVAAQARRPIGSQRRVRGTGHRILVDAEIRHEDSVDDVLGLAAGGDHGHAMDAAQSREVRLDCADGGFVREGRERSSIWLHGRREDALLWSLLPEDPR